MESIVFSTSNGNRYLKSFSQQILTLVHPAYDNSIDKVTGIFTSKDILHQLKKREYFEKHNYYGQVKPSNYLTGRVEPDYIKKVLLPAVGQIIFEVTEKCNLQCKYCAYEELYSKGCARSYNDMKIETMRCLLDYYNEVFSSSCRNESITISFYGGEPLVNIKLIEKTLDYIKEINFNNLNVKFSMTTNGILLKKHIKFLVGNNFSLLVSLDGNRKHNSYRVFRGNKKASFEMLKKNLLYIKQEYPLYYKNNIDYNSVYNNNSDFDEMYEFFKNELHKDLILSPLNSRGVIESKKKEFSKIYKDFRQDYLSSKYYNEINNKPCMVSFEHNAVGTYLRKLKNYKKLYYKSQYMNTTKEKSVPTGSCLPFGHKIFVTVNGAILPCERVPHNHILGKVEKNGVTIDFIKVAKSFNEMYEKVIKSCSTCYSYATCDSCTLQNVNNTFCEKHKNSLNYKNYLISTLNYLEKFPKSYIRSMEKEVF